MTFSPWRLNRFIGVRSGRRRGQGYWNEVTYKRVIIGASGLSGVSLVKPGGLYMVSNEVSAGSEMHVDVGKGEEGVGRG